MTEVYRNDPARVHIADGQRAAVGRALAVDLEARVRWNAVNDHGDFDAWTKPVCPGCYMVAVFNCAVELARQNGQSLKELGRSMACAFNALAMDGDHQESIESIRVILDSEGDACQLISNGNG
jgi:hypothetical protein